MMTQKPNPKRKEIELALQNLQNTYRFLAQKYGDAKLKIRYWTEQIEKLEQQIDAIGDEQKVLDETYIKTPEFLEEPTEKEDDSECPAPDQAKTGTSD